MRKWTNDELILLKENFSKMSNSDIVKIFSNRSLVSIYKKAWKMGLKRNEEIMFQHRSQGRVWIHKSRKNKKGYVLIYNPKHHRADSNGRVFEHIVVWENYYKKEIPDGYVIHHINGIKDDNRIENLKLMRSGEHTAFHNKTRRKKYE